MLERDFKAMLDLAGIPAASQVHLRSEGEVLRVDFFVTGHSTVFEVSGHRTHSTRAARANDAKRARASWSTGSATLEFTSDEVFGTPDVVQAELFRIAELLGFRETRPRPNAT